MADVEVGGFLSGGIDSSVIAIEAKKQNANFKTFSIGFPDEPFFDETKFAKAVAQKHNIEHEVFEISNQDLFENLHNVLDYLDEPFGDSSALPVYILSKLTSKQIKVALSGDGADEMFGGYNKHYAEYNALNRGFKGLLAKAFSPIGKLLPQGRNNKLLNLNRKLLRFNKGQKMPRKSRYWLWASICNEEEANYYLNERLIIKEQRLTDNAFEFKKLKDQFTKHITKQGTLNEVLYADMHMVLPNDMLTKVDLMSMANSLEVRTPFLDHELVEFAFTLPSAFKINSTIRKKILQETYKEELPEILFKRPKQGFEVPLLKWFQTELKSKIENRIKELLKLQTENVVLLDAKEEARIKASIEKLENKYNEEKKFINSNLGDISAQQIILEKGDEKSTAKFIKQNRSKYKVLQLLNASYFNSLTDGEKKYTQDRTDILNKMLAEEQGKLVTNEKLLTELNNSEITQLAQLAQKRIVETRKNKQEEERINRLKNWDGFPQNSINECLKYCNISMSNVDKIVINSDPKSNLKHKIYYMIKNYYNLPLYFLILYLY